MGQVSDQLTTGLPGLDRALRGLIPGDNIVWNIESIEDYQAFVTPYCQSALAKGEPVIYFRFAKHPPLIAPCPGVAVHELSAESEFESFVTRIAEIIEEVGHGGMYVFDCLSDLACDWHSDQMMANFFMLTCPHLLDVEAIAYFSLRRGVHSPHAIGAIARTAQVLLNVYRHKDKLYVHPWKVQQRHSPTMYMLHAWEKDDFRAVSDSPTISEVLGSAAWSRLNTSGPDTGLWNRTVLRASAVLAAEREGRPQAREAAEVFQQLLRMMVSRDERVLNLLQKHLTLADVLEIARRVIGNGLIGGKTVGMLLGRAVLRNSDPRWEALIEPHDSFYIGSDVFYTFLVESGIWWQRHKLSTSADFLVDADLARHRLLTGRFPEHMLEQFANMLDYFGQSPIIVRSSSLLEDNFGNAFAGKYESVFCANQGSREKRLEDFLSAVRTVYASTMSQAALTYRANRGLLGRDEQMALLVQRVSGAMYGSFYYPQIAGVGYSFNPYVWSEQIDPSAGMLRLVFGLGTRAVNRADDDYTRVVALNEPTRRPEAGFDQVCQYAQHRVDVLDLAANQLLSYKLADVLGQSAGLPIELFASRDGSLTEGQGSDPRQAAAGWVLTFDKLLTETQFVQDMRQMLRSLQEAYAYPVDTEFTMNFLSDGSYRIDLVQCRPLQVKEGGDIVEVPSDLAAEDIILESRGAVIGQSRLTEIGRLVYVVPSAYAQLPIADRFTVARVLRRLMHLERTDGNKAIILLGPGRWGTTTPSLGVPVSFADINTASVLCEIVTMSGDIVPDVSLGTHFFSDLVEMDILYMALFPSRDGNRLNEPLLAGRRNRLPELLPDAAAWAHVVWVIDEAGFGGGKTVKLNANALQQRVVCYLQHREPRTD